MSKPKTRKPGLTAAMQAPAASTEVRASEPPRALHPREGSKQGLVVGLLVRAEGASLTELVGATGWLPHTARAALTSLRKRGFTIDRVTAEGGRSVYRIAMPEPERQPEPKRRRGRQHSAAERPVQSQS